MILEDHPNILMVRFAVCLGMICMTNLASAKRNCD